MTLTLAIIFAFMVFMFIIDKGHLLFINITSLLIIAAISFGVGYGMAVFVVEIFGPLLKIVVGIAAVLICLALLANRGGSNDV